MTDLKTVSQKMNAVVANIAGTKKRHDDIILSLGRQLRFDRTRDCLSEFLSRKLRSEEGIIISGSMYRGLLDNVPLEGEMLALQSSLAKRDLALCCIYQKTENETLAVFLIIHRNVSTALQYKDRLTDALGVNNPQKPVADIIKTFIKLTEALEGKPSLESLIKVCSLLDGNEVYCITKNILEVYQIEPKQLSQLLDTAGHKVCPLIQTIDPDTPEVFREYEKLVGIMVSRTDEGIEFGKENIDVLLKICQTSEQPFLEASTKKIPDFLKSDEVFKKTPIPKH